MAFKRKPGALRRKRRAAARRRAAFMRKHERLFQTFSDDIGRSRKFPPLPRLKDEEVEGWSILAREREDANHKTTLEWAALAARSREALAVLEWNLEAVSRF